MIEETPHTPQENESRPDVEQELQKLVQQFDQLKTEQEQIKQAMAALYQMQKDLFAQQTKIEQLISNLSQKQTTASEPVSNSPEPTVVPAPVDSTPVEPEPAVATESTEPINESPAQAEESQPAATEPQPQPEADKLSPEQQAEIKRLEWSARDILGLRESIIRAKENDSPANRSDELNLVLNNLEKKYYEYLAAGGTEIASDDIQPSQLKSALVELHDDSMRWLQEAESAAQGTLANRYNEPLPSLQKSLADIAFEPNFQKFVTEEKAVLASEFGRPKDETSDSDVSDDVASTELSSEENSETSDENFDDIFDEDFDGDIIDETLDYESDELDESAEDQPRPKSKRGLAKKLLDKFYKTLGETPEEKAARKQKEEQGERFWRVKKPALDILRESTGMKFYLDEILQKDPLGMSDQDYAILMGILQFVLDSGLVDEESNHAESNDGHESSSSYAALVTQEVKNKLGPQDLGVANQSDNGNVISMRNKVLLGLANISNFNDRIKQLSKNNNSVEAFTNSQELIAAYLAPFIPDMITKALAASGMRPFRREAQQKQIDRKIEKSEAINLANIDQYLQEELKGTNFSPESNEYHTLLAALEFSLELKAKNQAITTRENPDEIKKAEIARLDLNPITEKGDPQAWQLLQQMKKLEKDLSGSAKAYFIKNLDNFAHAVYDVETNPREDDAT